MGIESICWLVLLVLLVLVELATMGLSTIWFAGGSVVAFIASILNANFIVQVILFLSVSILLLVFTRPFAAKYINRNKTKTNVESLVGKKAVVTRDIDNLHAEGEVKFQGLEWTARSLNENEKIPVGTIVDIIKVSGVKLIVQSEREE